MTCSRAAIHLGDASGQRTSPSMTRDREFGGLSSTSCLVTSRATEAQKDKMTFENISISPTPSTPVILRPFFGRRIPTLFHARHRGVLLGVWLCSSTPLARFLWASCCFCGELLIWSYFVFR